MRTKENNAQCERALGHPGTGTNCFPRPGFSSPETWLRPPAPPPSDRGLPAEGLGAESLL